MRPSLDVPFLPEETYVEFLNNCSGELDCVQFSLLGGRRLDSRIQLESLDFHDASIELLAELSGPRRYGLLNSRFYGTTLFTDRTTLSSVISTLDRCADQGVIDGIIYCDHYLLQLLSDEAPDLAGVLEAVPGVNTMLDTHAKVEAQLGYIG